MQITVKVVEFLDKLYNKRARLTEKKEQVKKKQLGQKAKIEKARRKAITEAANLLQDILSGKIEDPFGTRLLDTHYSTTIKGKKYKSRLVVPVKSVHESDMALDWKSKNELEAITKHIAEINNAIKVIEMSSEETMVLDEETGYYRLLHERSNSEYIRHA